MISSFFTYLLEASLCMALFAIAYRLFFRRLSHFQWNRWYLLASLILCLLIPFFPSLSFFLHSATLPPELFMLNIKETGIPTFGESSSTLLPSTQTESLFSYELISALVLGTYLIGCIYNAGQIIRNLNAVISLIRQSPQAKEKRYSLIRIPETKPAFSFLHYIFLPEEGNHLSKEDVGQILEHEKIHVRQKHTIDLLLFELAGIFLWFNPVIYYYKISIREVHEFIVDSTLIRQNSQLKKYGELLLKLVAQQTSSPIMNTFSNKQIMQRIKMLTQPKSSPMEKLKFLLSLPILAIALMLSSFLGTESTPSKSIPTDLPSSLNPSSQGVIIRKISWLGNAAFSDKELNKALGLQKGDIYDKEELNKRLNYNPSGLDISALYMDNGYLFFSVNPQEVFVNNRVDLAFSISEGPQANVGNIIIKGNKNVPSEEIRKLISIQKGELFNRSKLISAQNAIAQSGLFNPETIQINPIPYQKAEGGDWLVDLEYVVEEK